MNKLFLLITPVILSFFAFHKMDNMSNNMLTFEDDTRSPYSNPEDWDCIYLEEFNGSFSNNWVIRNDKGRHNEWFKSNNVTMDANYLYLNATQEQCPFSNCNKAIAGSEIYSGINFGNYDGNFQYGFFEIKCKFPSDGGFTSFWLGPKNGKYNYKVYPPEIDIFELERGATAYTSTIWGIDSDDNMGYKVRPVDKTVATDFSPNFFSQWHTVGVVWSPSKITFYLYGVEMGSSNYKVWEELKLMISYQLGGYPIDFSDGVAEPFIIDYVKRCIPKNAQFNTPKHWGYCWHNNRVGSSSVNYKNFDTQWKTTNNSRFFRVDFDGNGVDELLITELVEGNSDKIKIISLDNRAVSWKESWNTDFEQSNGKLGTDWHPANSDKLIVGNFEGSGLSEEVLLISHSKYSGLYNYSTSFTKKWGNGGPDANGYGWIGSWNLNKNDKFIAGDFTNNGFDELLCISETKYAKLLQFRNGSWSTIWGNGGPDSNGYGWIGSWNLNKNDKIYTGKFSSINRNELYLVSPTKYAKLLQFRNGSWATIWGNGGSDSNGYGWTGSWNLNPKDKFVIGDFNDDGFDEVSAYSHNGKYSKILKFQAGEFKSIWGNGGNGNIYDWKIRTSDRYIAGNFINDGICTSNAQVLAVRGENGFVDQNAINHKDFRAGLWFSPVSKFWLTHYVK